MWIFLGVLGLILGLKIIKTHKLAIVLLGLIVFIAGLVVLIVGIVGWYL